MKSFSRSALPLLALVLVLVFTACSGDTQPPVGTDPPADSTTAAPETTAPVPTAITADTLGKYAVVRPASAEQPTIDAASAMYTALYAVSPTVTIRDDFFREDLPDTFPGEFEILIGETNRPESAEFIAGLRLADYGCTFINGKLVIAGATPEGTAKAVNAFIQTVLPAYSAGDEVFYSPESDFLFTAEYKINSLTIGPTHIGDFRIVYPDGNTSAESVLARRLASYIAEQGGYDLPIVSDKKVPADGTPEIRIGFTNRDTVAPEFAVNEAQIGFDGTNLSLGGSSFITLNYALEHLIDDITLANDVPFTPSAKETLTQELAEMNELSAMSFNIYYSDFSDERADRVLDIILTYMPDTIGVQEATAGWMRFLRSRLDGIYTFVGEGRNGGDDGEHSAIGYKTGLFELVEEDTFWLSDTPDTVSKYSESAHNRIITYARLKRLTDGREMLVMNTHLDHASSQAREKQALVAAEFIRQHTDLPIIFSGDFNTSQGSKAYRNLTASGIEASSAVAEEAMHAPTYQSGTTIDFIFVNPNLCKVHTYKVCNEKINGDYPSDHYPVYITYTLN